MKKHPWRVCLFLILTFSFQGCNNREFVVNPAITSASCPGATFSLTLIRGTTYMGTMTIPYAEDKPAFLKIGNTIESTGVKGLTAVLKTDSSRSLIYAVSGSPDTTGNALFILDLGKQSCKVTIPVSE